MTRWSIPFTLASLRISGLISIIGFLVLIAWKVLSITRDIDDGAALWMQPCANGLWESNTGMWVGKPGVDIELIDKTVGK